MMTAAHIRSIRAYTGMTQDKFARLMNVNRYEVVLWEKYGIADAGSIEKKLREIEAKQK